MLSREARELRLAQRAVSRMLYGRRDEPYAVISTVGRRARAGVDPLAVLPEIAMAVVDGLRVPYAAIKVLGDDDQATTVAEHGRWAGEPQRFPMTAHGRPVGELALRGKARPVRAYLLERNSGDDACQAPL